MWNLPRDLAEEVLCRVPLKSLKRVRSTCKTWNTLSNGNNLKKNKSFMNLRVMIFDYTIYLISFDLDELCMKREAKLVRLDDQFQVDNLFHCDGLLLCMNNDYNHTKLVVWNPYCFQTRFIDTPPKPRRLGRCAYALGHNDNHDHKILRFIIRPDCVEFLIYDLNNSDDHTWRVLDDFATREWTISHYHRGISLKGNTYFFAESRRGDTEPCLVCFDFTTERFGPCLPLHLPLSCASLWYTVSLSSVRDEQLVLLYQCWETSELEIWVTSKIEPDEVTWNSKVFLAVDMRPPLTCSDFQFTIATTSFFIDEEKKVAVVFDKTKGRKIFPPRDVAYVIGVDGSLKEVEFGQSEYTECRPLVYSYVPSLVQLN
ncbi:unnamed protein product [Cochlearia groenlandica]